MSKEVKNKIVPKLRFPEFRDSGEWSIRPLNNLAKEINEKAGTSRYKLMSITSGVGLVSQIEKFGREIAGDSYKNYLVIKKGDFAYNKSSTKRYPEGEIALLENEDKGAVPNSIFTCFRFDSSFILSAFAKYPFINNIHGKWLSNFIAVGARANGALQVNTKDLFTLPIIFPSLPEQLKIADCLSSLDELITAQSQKLEALKAHKKGLMQQLFPAEGETVLKLRFAEFKNSGEWILSPLKNIFTIFQGFAFSSSDSVNAGVRWLKIADVGIQHMNHNTLSFLPIEYRDKYKNFLVKKRDYVIALTRPILGKELKIAPVDEVLHESLLNQRVGKVVTSECADFVYYLLQDSKLISNIEKSIAGNDPPNLSSQQIGSIETYIPSTKEEQQRIASCLFSLDELISAQAEKINTLKTHKKGLMQQLFPNTQDTSEWVP